MNDQEARTDRPEAAMSRVQVETGWTGDDQEGSFMNATLQSVSGGKFEFSIAMFIDLPPHNSEEELATTLTSMLSHIAARYPQVSFDVKLGLAGGGDDDD